MARHVEAGPQRVDPALQNPFRGDEESHERRKIPNTIGKDLYHALENIAPEQYAAHPIGRGGEHVVFAFDDRPETGRRKGRDVVVKINFRNTFPILRAFIRQGPEGEIARRRAMEKVEEDMRQQEMYLKELRDYFGREAVPVEKFLLKEVPVSREVVNALIHHHVSDRIPLPEKLPAWIMVQRKMDLQGDEHVSLHGGAPEGIRDMPEWQKEHYKIMYEAVHEILVNGQEEGHVREDILDSVFFIYPYLRDVAEMAEKDPAFKTKLQETIRKMIRYTQETTRCLDLVGSDNILLVKGQKGWTLKMPDPMVNGEYTMYELALAASKIKNGLGLTPMQLQQAYVTLNSFRVLNALAIIADIPERLEAPGDISELDPARWDRVLRGLS